MPMTQGTYLEESSSCRLLIELIHPDSVVVVFRLEIVVNRDAHARLPVCLRIYVQMND